ncbi:hypothetical protein [Parabacteroides leei]|uniref:hypothetical protein n=1 Tax=Parabacteroides leei TaxID=2939491 RepID=UPI00189C0B1A|nr:hypothetical protein [Parabacteroides goldsteinii]
MEKNKYVLEENYHEIEDNLYYVQKILEMEKPTDMTIQERVEDFRDKILGSYDISSIFENMITNCQRTICIANCALRDLEKIRKEHPEIHFNSSIRSKDPATEVANAAMLLSEFTPAVNERIIYSIYASYPIFCRNMLGIRLGQIYQIE